MIVTERETHTAETRHDKMTQESRYVEKLGYTPDFQLPVFRNVRDLSMQFVKPARENECTHC